MHRSPYRQIKLVPFFLLLVLDWFVKQSPVLPRLALTLFVIISLPQETKMTDSTISDQSYTSDVLLNRILETSNKGLNYTVLASFV